MGHFFSPGQFGLPVGLPQAPSKINTPPRHLFSTTKSGVSALIQSMTPPKRQSAIGMKHLADYPVAALFRSPEKLRLSSFNQSAAAASDRPLNPLPSNRTAAGASNRPLGSLPPNQTAANPINLPLGLVPPSQKSFAYENLPPTILHPPNQAIHHAPERNPCMVCPTCSKSLKPAALPEKESVNEK